MRIWSPGSPGDILLSLVKFHFKEVKIGPWLSVHVLMIETIWTKVSNYSWTAQISLSNISCNKVLKLYMGYNHILSSELMQLFHGNFPHFALLLGGSF